MLQVLFLTSVYVLFFQTTVDTVRLVSVCAVTLVYLFIFSFVLHHSDFKSAHPDVPEVQTFSFISRDLTIVKLSFDNFWSLYFLPLNCKRYMGF